MFWPCAHEIECETLEFRVMANDHHPACSWGDLPDPLQQLCRARVIEAIFVDHFWLYLELGQDESESVARPPRRRAEHEIGLDPALGHGLSYQRRVVNPTGGERAVLIRKGRGFPARFGVAQQTECEQPGPLLAALGACCEAYRLVGSLEQRAGLAHALRLLALRH